MDKSVSMMTDEDSFQRRKRVIYQATFYLFIYLFLYVNKRDPVFLAYMGIHSSYDLSCEKVTGKYVRARILTLLPGKWE